MSLDPLRDRLQKTKQLVAWITSATEKAADFPSDVVQKVIADYTDQYDDELPELLEHAEAASLERQTLADRAEDLESHKAEVEARIDEFKLRHVIGELSEDEFAEREEEARRTVDEDAIKEARDGIASIDELLNEVGEVQNQVGSLLGRDSSTSIPIGQQEAASEEEDSVSGVAELGFQHSDSEADAGSSVLEIEASVVDAQAPADELGEAAYAAGGGDDAAAEEWEVDAVASQGSLGPDSSSVDESGVESLDVLPGADSQVSGAGEDLESVEEPADDQAGEGTAVAPAEEQDASPPPVHGTADFGASASEAAGDGPRLAVTSPGTDEEVFPFNGDVMSLGRGRNNDIQIKNDGKISRYHCRIFRRGDEFIVEDNKSSNGTLVDGKLVTRQPLIGGELIQVGETRVHFFMR